MTTQNRIKTVLTLAVVAMAILVPAATSANAGIIVYEGFQYGAGENLKGQPDGPPEVDATGLAGMWSGDATEEWTIQSESLSFGPLPTAGGHVTNGNGPDAYRNSDLNARGLTAGAQSSVGGAGEIWFSILMKNEVDPASWGAAEDGFGFTNQALTNPKVRLNSGGGLAGFGIGAEGFADFQPYAWDGTNIVTGTVVNPPLDTTTGETYLLVGHISFDTGTGGADVYTLYNYELSGTLTQIGDTLQVDVTQADLDTVNITRQRSVAYDELRIGISLKDVLSEGPVDAGADMITWSGQGVQLDPNFADGYTPNSFTWSADDDTGVVFDPNEFVEAPIVTITKDTDNPSPVKLTLAVTDGTDAYESSMTIDVYDDACLAAKAVGPVVFDSTDIDANCITNFEDFALMAITWLDDYTLTEPVAK